MKFNSTSRTLTDLYLAWCLGLCALVAGMAPAHAWAAFGAVTAPPTTTVQDILSKADGSPAGGTVLVSWPAFQTVNGSSVPAGNISVTIGPGGLLSVALVPNAGSNPMGTYYTAVYHLNDGSVTHEFWLVPVSSAPVMLSAIRSAVLPASVAMQTASTAYVNQAIANAITAAGLSSSGSGASGTATVTNSTAMLARLPQRTNLLGEHLLNEGSGAVAHDTSGHGNDAPITNAVWEGAIDLNFPTTGAYYALPSAENAANTWMFAIYSAPFGNAVTPQTPGYGAVGNFGGNPSLLCGSTNTLSCFIASSLFGPRSYRFLAFSTDQTEASETLTSGVHIVAIVCGDGAGNLTHYFYDGREVGGYIHQGNSTCSHDTGGNYQIGGSSSYGGTWFTGKIAGDWQWSTRLTQGEVASATAMVADFIRNKGFTFGTRPVVRTAPVLIAGLDSRTAGAGNPAGGDWVSLLQLTDPTFTRLNLAVSGSTVFDHCAMFDSLYAPQISPLGGQVIVSLWGSVNDGAQTARQRADSLQCLVKKSKAAGARVILATEISSSQLEGVDKDQLDAILRSEAYLWGVDNLVDLATNPTLGADGAYQNTNCFPDGLHPGPNCESLIATMESNAVNELIGSTESNRHSTTAASYAELAGDRFLDLAGTGAQTVTLPDCTGYTLRREVVNAGSATATVTGSGLASPAAIASGSRGIFLPLAGPLTTGGCHWERVQ